MIYDTETMAAPRRAVTRRNAALRGNRVETTHAGFDRSVVVGEPDRPAVRFDSAQPVPAVLPRPSSEASASDALAIYFREIMRYPRITPEEETELAGRIRLGDEVARERMITANLRLVVKIAREFDGFGLPLLDLISEGNIGLMKSVERFDPERGARLSVYASFWIKQGIRRALANHARTIRLPVHVHEKLLHIGRVAHRLQDALGRVATDEEIGDELGMDPSRVRRFRQAGHPAASLDLPSSEDEGRSLAESIPDPAAVGPDETLAHMGDLNLLHKFLSTLDLRERRVLHRRFGLDGDGEKTLEDIGEEIGLTRERIRQIQQLALKKLQRLMQRHDGMAAAA